MKKINIFFDTLADFQVRALKNRCQLLELCRHNFIEKKAQNNLILYPFF